MVIDVCGLASGTSAMPAAMGFRSMMIVHHREAADRHGEDSRKFLRAGLDPILAATRAVALPKQKRATHTASNAVFAI